MRRDVYHCKQKCIVMYKISTYRVSTTTGWVQRQQLVQQLVRRGALQKAFPSDTQQLRLLSECVGKCSGQHVCKATETAVLDL